jgi:hypothetical protein
MLFSSWKTPLFAAHQNPPNPTRGCLGGRWPFGPPTNHPSQNSHGWAGVGNQHQTPRQPPSRAEVSVDPNCQPDSNSVSQAVGIRPTQPVLIDRDVNDIKFPFQTRIGSVPTWQAREAKSRDVSGRPLAADVDRPRRTRTGSQDNHCRIHRKLWPAT